MADPVSRAQKEELRRRIEHDPQLKNDFDFMITNGLAPTELLTGLWLDCNMMKADRQTLLRRAREEWWPTSEDTLRRIIKNIRGIARQIETTNKTKFSPTRRLIGQPKNLGDSFARLPETLRAYAVELERQVEILALSWKLKTPRIPTLVTLTRQHSLYARVRSRTGGYHLNRLLRLVNAAREVAGYPTIQLRAFTIWLNRLEKRRKERDRT